MSWCSPPEANEFGDDYLDWSDDDVCNSKYVISSSSDEEVEQFLERIKSRKFVKKAKVSDGKDDFEREMASELSMTMQQLTASFYKKSTTGATSSSTENASESKAPEESSEFYDEIYFDSDDSESEELSHKASGSTSRKGNRRILSNDELFYDPKMDDRDQAWMDKMRRSYQVKNKKRSGDSKASKKSQPLPESDAVLNCPACLTMLCMDCQRHEIYHNQYRAMFVFNCNIDWTEVLKFPNKNQKKAFFKNKKKLKKMQEEVKQSPSGQQEVKETSSQQEVKETSSQQEVKETSSLQGEVKEILPSLQEEVKEILPSLQEEVKEILPSQQEEVKEILPSHQEEVMEILPSQQEEVKEMSSSQQKNNVEVKDISGDKNIQVNMVDAKKTDGSNPVAAESTNKIFVSGRELEASVSTHLLTENVCFGNNPEELFHPVTCKICNTKVGVYDKEEVYHFFNIVTSY